MKLTSTRRLTECAIMLALANVLSFVKIPRFFGGGVTLFSMLPLVIIACRYGTPTGLLTAFAHSCLQLIFGLGNVQYANSTLMALGIIGFDYIVAYSVIGLSGFFCTEKGKPRTRHLIVGIVLTFLMRLFCHIGTGIWIWDVLFPNSIEYLTGCPQIIVATVYSVIYNAEYMLPEILITSVAAAILNKTTRLFEKI